ncbi:MAG: hypothetical protein INR73_25640 [Williamsia sp.]|nr:hypothetical protein [Williamsia sp.]
MDRQLLEQHKTYANNIVGLWHEAYLPTQMLLFSFLDDLEGEADVVVFEANPWKATYSIVSRQEEFWFLIIWEKGENPTLLYSIEILENSLMILNDGNNDRKIFIRKQELNFAVSLLKTLG